MPTKQTAGKNRIGVKAGEAERGGLGKEGNEGGSRWETKKDGAPEADEATYTTIPVLLCRDDDMLALFYKGDCQRYSRTTNAHAEFSRHWEFGFEL